MPVSGSAWIERFAAALEVDAPGPEDVEALLELAGVAAHGSERIAAPISCWLVAKSGYSLEEARRVAEALAEEFQGLEAT
jgi:hypothetical protein